MEEKIRFFRSLETVSPSRTKGKLYQVTAIQAGHTGIHHVWYINDEGYEVNTNSTCTMSFLTPVKATRLAKKMYPNAVQYNNYILVEK